MRTTVKKEVTKKEERKNDLKEAFVLWINKSKKDEGTKYLSGYHFDKEKEEQTDLIGFFNTNKKNPNEPDIRIYLKDEEEHKEEVASLWSNVSEKGVKYLTGKTNENEKLIGFFNKEKINQRPDIRVYFKEEDKKQEMVKEEVKEEDLPF